MTLPLLHRAILSHLVVAVPPAVVLGLLVVDINERNLRTEAQQLHLAVAGRMRDAIEAEVGLRFELLTHAERILSIDRVGLEDKTRLLRALVAGGAFDWLALYDTTGRRDSVVRAVEAPVVAPETLPEAARNQARTERRAVHHAAGADVVHLVVPLVVDDEIRGFVAGPLPLDALTPILTALQSGFLGTDGRLQVVDAGGRGLMASGVELRGADAWATASDLGAIAAGISTTVEIDGQRWLRSLVSSPSLGWVVAGARPESVALASIDEVERRTLLLAVIAALVAGIVGLLFARMTAEPVRALAQAVRQSARAGFEAHVEAPGAPELAALGGAFNDALGQLSRYRKELRHRSQLQVRLSRQLSPAALHALMSQSWLDAETTRAEAVSVVYVDLSPGTALNGPDLIDLLSDLYAEACAAIEQHGGRVDRYSGDAVVGVFPESLVGAPARTAHVAAEEILRRVGGLRSQATGAQLDVSIGLASQVGQVVRSAEDGELTVAGEVVEQAAALQQSAGPKQIAMDEASRAEVSGG